MLFVAARQGPAARPAGLLRRAGEEPVRAVGAVGQGHAADPDRARAGGVLPLQRLEHRRRGPVRRRRAGRPAGSRCRPGPRRPGWARHRVADPLAGVLGGMFWAGIVALLRDRFNANEILVSLMLVYVADLLLSYLVYGPWKDPKGYNFPQTITFLPR